MLTTTANGNGVANVTIAVSGNQSIDGVLIGQQWSLNSSTDSYNLTYSFPNSSADYGTSKGSGPGQYPDPGGAPFNHLTQLTAQQQSVIQYALSLVSSYTDLTFTQITETTSQHADLRFADSFAPPTSYSFDPGSELVSGDAFYGPSAQGVPSMGSYAATSLIHELGHTLGLAHGEPTGGGGSLAGGDGVYGSLPANQQDVEYSVMNYPTYIGGPLTWGSAGQGSLPQTYMMDDIAALQYMYGANFGNAGVGVAYSWNATTGQEFINGVGQPLPALNQNGVGNIFMTVWTGGADSTFNLSNFNDNAHLDMRPGEYMEFSTAQLAALNGNPQLPSAPYPAQGNVYNALLYQGNTSSEINNLITGNGDDTVIGNDLYNTITLGSGTDNVTPGGAGADIICGTGDDTVLIGNNTGGCAIEGNSSGTATLDYNALSRNLTVNVQTGIVNTGVFADLDNFTNVSDFDGGSASNTFLSDGPGGFTFNGDGSSNTLDYSADQNVFTLTIDLWADTGSQDALTGGRYSLGVVQYQDTFSDIQTFVGTGSGNTTFKSIGTDAYTFTGQGSNNTLDYSEDDDPNGVVIDLVTDTVAKDKIFNGPSRYVDAFSGIQTFVGSEFGKTTFVGIGPGDYTFTGEGVNNTLDYSNDQRGITINLGNDTATKYNLPKSQPYTSQDTFSDIQSFIGSLGGDDTFVDGPGAAGTTYTFTGAGATNTVDFNGARSEYSIAESTVNGKQQFKVTDEGTTGDATLDLFNVQYLDFADGTTVTVANFTANPPVVAPVSSNVSASNGQAFAASSLFTATDPAGNPFTQYTFQDTGSGGGHFVLDGVAQLTNQAINISAAQLSQLTYQSGSGADTLWVKASDGVQSSAWSSAFTVTAPVDSGPVEGVSNLTAAAGQWLTASSLFTYSDPFGSAATQYGFWNSGAGGGHFELPGIALPTNQEDIISAAQLSELYYVAGSGTDTLWVQANDGAVWGAWSSSFSVSLPVDTGPVVSVANLTATHGESFNASSLFTYSDPIGAAATEYDVWNAGTGGGHFVLGNVLGTTLPANQDNIITAAQLSQLSYQSGSGTDTLWVRANDGTMWGNWSQAFTVTAPVDSGPVVTPINANVSSFTGQSLNVGSLFTESNPVSAATEYDVWSGSGGGQLLFNGTALPANQDNIVSALQLDFGELTYQVGNGSGELWIKANDGTVWGPGRSRSR